MAETKRHAQPLRKADKPLYQNEKRSIRVTVAQTYDKPRVAETVAQSHDKPRVVKEKK